jgi:hypothetical protein
MIDRANDDYVIDITRARALLGWKPKRGLHDTMPKMVAALKADPAGWYREHGLELPSNIPAVHEPVATRVLEMADADAGLGHIAMKAEPRAAKMAAGLPYKMASTIYTCPMHPDIRQSSPGNCPRCGMTLEPVA